ncbi:MAG: type I-C CRISPR-associated protein Cas5 [Clostridiales bacterium]|nr:type I-C CRISPR-associated protein Cas5 [Clostridiales bacterium]
MQMSVKVEVRGDYACFTRPEMKVERVSYDVMTPSASRGLLEAIYWHPGMKWVIDRIYVLNPIEFTNVRRNEVKSKIPCGSIKTLMNGGKAKDYICTSEDIQQRAALILRDVHYVIEAHFELTDKTAPNDNEGKFCDIIRRRLEKGQCYHQPYFGCREFPASFKKWEGGEITTAYPDEDKDLGFMLFDMDYSDKSDISPMFFKATLTKGVLDLRDCEVFR